MNAEDAERELSDFELVACLQGALGDVKELRDVCLEADIPVLLGREDACCGKGGCGCAPKLQLLARPEDGPRSRRSFSNGGVRWRCVRAR